MSQLKRTLRNSLPAQELRRYMAHRFGWSKTAIDSIHWEAFRQAYNKSKPGMKVFITKLLFRWLPVGTRLFRQKEWTNNECYLCKEPETVEHLCQCPQRQTWRDEFITALRKFLVQECTDPCLRDVLVQGSTSWLRGDETASSLEIGWDAFQRGYIPSEWITNQEEYYRAHGHDAKTKTGIGWAVKLSTYIWARMNNLWKKRCSDIHDKEEVARMSREHSEAIIRTRAIYSRKDDLLHGDRDLLDMPLEDRLRMPARHLIAWVKSTMPVISISIADRKDEIKRGSRDIRSYFIRQPRPPPDPDPDTDP